MCWISIYVIMLQCSGDSEKRNRGHFLVAAANSPVAYRNRLFTNVHLFKSVIIINIFILENIEGNKGRD